MTTLNREIIFPRPVGEGTLLEIFRHIGNSPDSLPVDGNFFGHFSFSDLEGKVDKEDIHGTITYPEYKVEASFAVSKDDRNGNGIRFSRIKLLVPQSYERMILPEEAVLYGLIEMKVKGYFNKTRRANLSVVHAA